MKFALNDEAKEFSWFSGDWFLWISFFSYAWMSLTCSRSFPPFLACVFFIIIFIADLKSDKDFSFLQLESYVFFCINIYAPLFFIFIFLIRFFGGTVKIFPILGLLWIFSE